MGHDTSFLHDLGLGADQVSDAGDDREAHATDYGTEEAGGRRPDAVVWPESTDDVAAILAAANDRGVPVTPYASGTGTEGAAVPVRGGISLDTTRMDAVRDVRPADLQIDVGPGALGSAVEAAAAEHGLFFPAFPQSRDVSTVGGMVSTDASGTTTVKYGEVRDWVLRLEAVLADGSVVEAGSRAVKTSSGYNLADLLVGSEGTLAVVTEVTLRLAPEPVERRGGRAAFDDVDDAAAAVSDAIRSGVDVARIELLDPPTAEIAAAYAGVDLAAVPTVFVSVHGRGAGRELDRCREVFERHGVRRFETAADEAEMADLWSMRRDLAFALKEHDPDLAPLAIGDVTVPIGEYPDLIHFVHEVADELGVLVPAFGHAGDGNVHYTPLVDLDDPEAVERGREAYDRIVRRAIEVGGTATGEHGVGLGKRRYLPTEHGENAVEAMRKVKDALDPNGILNPGKVLPDPDGGPE